MRQLREQASRLVSLLGEWRDDRRWHGVAAALGKMVCAYPEQVERAAIEHAGHELPLFRIAASQTLSIYLEHTSSLERTRLIAEWTLAESHWQRLAIARALCDPVYAVGSPAAIDLLLHDRYRAVRAAAVDAAASRMGRWPHHLCVLLERLVLDPQPMVRQRVISALQAAAEAGDGDAIEQLCVCATGDDPDCAEHAVDALAAVTPHDPVRVMSALARVVEHADERDARVLHRVVEDIRRVGSFAPEPARRVLDSLDKHPEPWLREEAHTAALRLI
jgi:hypothetical protein